MEVSDVQSPSRNYTTSADDTFYTSCRGKYRFVKALYFVSRYGLLTVQVSVSGLRRMDPARR